MNFRDEVKAVMRLWPEEKKMTLLQQQRIVTSSQHKDISIDLSKLFFDEAPLIVYGIVIDFFFILILIPCIQ
jgi:hypothetical protein